jgi:hypothetical protein
LKDRRASTPLIIGLQEVDRAKARSGNLNHAKAIADALGIITHGLRPPRTVSRESGARKKQASKF